MTGKITEIKNSQYGNMYIADDEGNQLYIYGMYDKTGEIRFDAMNPQPKVGDTVMVVGVACNYNGAQMKNAWLLKLNGEDYVSSGTPSTPDNPDTPDTPDVPSVGDVKENTAYKFYLTQVSVGKVLYATADLDQGKFIKGTTDAKAALDFYAEKVNGGWKFYTTIDGAKMYLHAHTETKEDGKVSKFIGYAAESDNIWYYKADVNGWFVTIDGAEYVLGTYNTYETFSMSEARHLTADNTGKTQFPGNLILKADAESADAPVTPDTPDTPDTPSTGLAGVSDLKADTAYKLFFNQVKAGKLLFITGETDNDKYIKATTDAKAALDVYAEAVTGGFKFYVNIDGAKKYIHAHTETSNGKTSKFIAYADSTDNVWVYKADINAWTVTIDGVEYAMGTYNTYETLSISESSYFTAANTGVSQFPGNFALKADAEAYVPAEPDTPDTPDTPAVPGASDVKVDTPYYISGINANGNLYFSGTVKSGRIEGVADKSSAVTVKLEAGASAGEFYIYFMNGDAKTYIAAVEDKSAGLSLVTAKDDTCVWLIDSSAKTIVSKNLGDRGIATQVGSTYNNFSSYATSNFTSDEYAVSWLVDA